MPAHLLQVTANTDAEQTTHICHTLGCCVESSTSSRMKNQAAAMLQTWRDGASKHAFCRGCFRWQSSRDLSSRSHDICLAPACGMAAHHANSLLRRRRLPAASICQGGAAASPSCSHLGSSARHRRRFACTKRATTVLKCTSPSLSGPGAQAWSASLACQQQTLSTALSVTFSMMVPPLMLEARRAAGSSPASAAA